MRFISLSETDSTNAHARRLAEQGEKGPLWVRADRQTSGRGRRSRKWESLAGNLYASGLYPHSGSAHDAALLSFAAALAVADCLEHYVPRERVSLKWPNDVLLEGRKSSGILLEACEGCLIIGIGVNLVHHPSGMEYEATHLLEHIRSGPTEADEALAPPALIEGRPAQIEAQAVLKILAARFDYWRDVYGSYGFGPLRTNWLARAHNVPGPVTVRLPQETFTGEALGLGENGALRVRLASGKLREVHAGDVFFGVGD